MIMRNFAKVSLTVAGAVAAAGAFTAPAFSQDQNACPVDGCQVEIVSVEKNGDELKLMLEANFAPDMSKNHLHIWWGENYTVEQVSGNAESEYGVEQGDWHPTDEYPEYMTQSAVSLEVRGDATSICVTAADRDHDILDPMAVNCMSVADMLN